MPKLKVSIRPAEGLDIINLLKVGKVYYEEAKDWGIFNFDSDIAAINLAIAIEQPNQEILLAIVNGELIGFMWCQISNPVFSSTLIAKDLFVYISPKLRGLGVGRELAIRFEEWGRERGAKVFTVGANSGIRDNSQASKMYKILGYNSFGSNFIKV